MPKFTNPDAADKWANKIYGCSLDEAIRINGAPIQQPDSFAGRYRSQRGAASKRGIDSQISFAEWVTVWLDSGRWDQRGRGIGAYCMARNGDIGPYSVANVSIQLATTNSRDGIEKARPAMTKTGGRLGLGRGW